MACEMACTGCNRHENSMCISGYWQRARPVIASDAETLKIQVFSTSDSWFFQYQSTILEV
jgi:hypothetical protein